MDLNNEVTENNQKTAALRIFIRVVSTFIMLGLFLFLPAGTLEYWQAWLYCATLFIPASLAIAYYFRKDPEFIARRILKRREKEQEQKSLQNFFTIFYLIAFLIPGFDYRFHWSNVPFSIVVMSDLLTLCGYLFILQVLKENRYASAIIEVNQGQKVIDTGSYKIVRHPMYTGSLIMFSFTPLALGSYWALIPFLIVIPSALILRILGEEKYLTINLLGYTEYCQRTKYRLIPYIW